LISASLFSAPWRSWMRISSNGAPTFFSTSHGRSDQVDHAFVPITSSMGPLRFKS
jgi:hypothetical protein